MSHILTHYMKLVPTREAKGQHTLPNGISISFDDTRFHEILIGGDQLTVARVRGAQAIRDTHDKRVDRFEGVIPVVEDWHARMTFLKVYVFDWLLCGRYASTCNYTMPHCFLYRLYGGFSTVQSQQKIRVLCTNYATPSTAQ